MRLLTINGRALSIIGNHELWVIEGDFERWSTNEERYIMQGSHPGTIIHDPIISGAKTLNESMKISFSILEGCRRITSFTTFSFRNGLQDSEKKIFDEMYTSIIPEKDIELEKVY